MGYAQALLQRDVQDEKEALEKKAAKKGLLGSIGRTLGSLGVMAITGGTVNPVTLGLLTGGASFLGGAIGSAAGGKLTGGKFFSSDREELETELGALGSQNIVSSLKSGITAGIGQKLNLMKSGDEATKLSQGFGMDFKGSMVGKAMKKPIPVMEKATLSPLSQKMASDPIATLKEISSRNVASKKFASGEQSLWGGGSVKDLFNDPGQGGKLNVSGLRSVIDKPSESLLNPYSQSFYLTKLRGR